MAYSISGSSGPLVSLEGIPLPGQSCSICLTALDDCSKGGVNLGPPLSHSIGAEGGHGVHQRCLLVFRLNHPQQSCSCGETPLNHGEWTIGHMLMQYVLRRQGDLPPDLEIIEAIHNLVTERLDMIEVCEQTLRDGLRQTGSNPAVDPNDGKALLLSEVQAIRMLAGQLPDPCRLVPSASSVIFRKSRALFAELVLPLLSRVRIRGGDFLADLKKRLPPDQLAPLEALGESSLQGPDLFFQCLVAILYPQESPCGDRFECVVEPLKANEKNLVFVIAVMELIGGGDNKPAADRMIKTILGQSPESVTIEALNFLFEMIVGDKCQPPKLPILPCLQMAERLPVFQQLDTMIKAKLMCKLIHFPPPLDPHTCQRAVQSLLPLEQPPEILSMIAGIQGLSRLYSVHGEFFNKKLLFSLREVEEFVFQLVNRRVINSQDRDFECINNLILREIPPSLDEFRALEQSGKNIMIALLYAFGKDHVATSFLAEKSLADQIKESTIGVALVLAVAHELNIESIRFLLGSKEEISSGDILDALDVLVRRRPHANQLEGIDLCCARLRQDDNWSLPLTMHLTRYGDPHSLQSVDSRLLVHLFSSVLEHHPVRGELLVHIINKIINNSTNVFDHHDCAFDPIFRVTKTNRIELVRLLSTHLFSSPVQIIDLMVLKDMFVLFAGQFDLQDLHIDQIMERLPTLEEPFIRLALLAAIISCNPKTFSKILVKYRFTKYETFEHVALKLKLVYHSPKANVEQKAAWKEMYQMLGDAYKDQRLPKDYTEGKPPSTKK